MPLLRKAKKATSPHGFARLPQHLAHQDCHVAFAAKRASAGPESERNSRFAKMRGRLLLLLYLTFG